MNEFKKNILRSTRSAGLPTMRYCYRGIYDPDDPIHVPPGGIVTWEDAFGVEHTQSGLTNASPIFSVYASNVPETNDAAYLADCDTGLPI